MSALYDKNGFPIKVGDVLKVFHFIGARRKRHYMYKQVVGEETLPNGSIVYLQVSHLNLKPFDDSDGGYWIAQDGSRDEGIEIVDSCTSPYFDKRPRQKKEEL